MERAGCNAGGYGSCPSEFGVEDISLDGNGNNGLRGTGTSGAVLNIRGHRYFIRGVDVVSSPYDGIYSETSGGALSPPFIGMTAINYGNAATYNTVQPNNSSHNGLTFYAPPDSRFTELIPFSNGNYGTIFGCSSNACGASAYLTNFHAWKNNSWGIEVETILQGSNIQSESNHGGIHIVTPGSPIGSGDHGIVLVSNVQTWNNDGDGLYCESPDVNYAQTPDGYQNYSGYAYLKNIQGIQPWSNDSCRRTSMHFDICYFDAFWQRARAKVA